MTAQVRRVLPWLALFAAYVGVTRLASFLFFQSSTYVIWTGAGVGFAGLYLGGLRLWTAIAAAVALTSFANGNPLPLTAVAVVGNASQAVAGVVLLKRLGFHDRMARMRDAVSLSVAASVSSVIAPTIGTVGRWLFGTPLSSLDSSIFWASWWLAGAIGIVIVTSLCATWSAYLRDRTPGRANREAVAVLTALSAVTFVMFWTEPTALVGIPLPYFWLGALFWLAIRSSPRYVALANVVTIVLGLTGMLYGQREIPVEDLGQRMVQVDLFVMVFAAMALIIVGATEERRSMTRDLRHHVTQLESALRQLRRTDQERADFIAFLGHEIRNPLTPVVAYVQLVREEVADRPDTLKHLDIIDNNVHLITRLLDDLLDIARIARQQFPIHREVISLNDSLRRAIMSMSPEFEASGLSCELQLGEDVDIDADPVRIEQVFNNLLSNAVKYTETGGRVSVTTKRDDGLVTIWVADDGIGIAPEYLTEIFDPFTRGGNEARRSGGLGLGLYLSRQLVTLHGGTLVARSEGSGRGSEFIIELPIAHELRPDPYVHNDRTNGHASSRLNGHLEPSRGSVHTILIVDDNKAGAAGLGMILENAGYDVRIAVDANDADKTLARFTPDSVLLDIGLPGKDGYEYAPALRKRYGDRLLLIAVTGYGQDEDKRRAAEVGFDYHFTKPVDTKTLREVLASP